MQFHNIVHSLKIIIQPSIVFNSPHTQNVSVREDSHHIRHQEQVVRQ